MHKAGQRIKTPENFSSLDYICIKTSVLYFIEKVIKMFSFTKERGHCLLQPELGAHTSHDLTKRTF